MTEQEWLNFALAQMHSGQWFGWRTHDDSGNKISNDQRMTYENIIVHDSSITKPTEAEVNAKIEELKNFETEFYNKQLSGKQKLKDLGLNDDEIQALMGA
tara:strand:- start:38 stop:337 length:300 start_codon:yes stop_codon:yes gene_type:complete